MKIASGQEFSGAFVQGLIQSLSPCQGQGYKDAENQAQGFQAGAGHWTSANTFSPW